ncbi:MAG: hypothetical protein AAGU11_02410 [Syntrophobacteraceae bacterium]
MIICSDILERACKDMIETILFCLQPAIKGTIYRIGQMPRLQAVRITSGERDEATGAIRWGLPEISDYNHPGKSWEEYRDRPGYVKEAMAWCVEKGKSWTADDPDRDARSVRKQLSDEAEGFHHMEPVLIKKSFLYGNQIGELPYPVDYAGNPIWRDSECIVVAVIKIHFKPGTITRGDYSTKIIKKLSQTLGTELLSLHVRETLSKAQKELARQRLQSCNVLAHELRNTLIKLGFIFSAINAEISYLREQWELQIEMACPEIDSKRAILGRLSQIVCSGQPNLNGAPKLANLCEELVSQQQELACLPLMPCLGEKWVENKIRPKWRRLLIESNAWDSCREEVQSLLGRLQKVMWIGMDRDIADRLDHLPDDLKAVWPKLAYIDFTADKAPVLDEILRFLDHPGLAIPHKQQTRKILTALKTLVEMIPEVEERSNRIIYSLKNGGSADIV